MSDIAHPNHPVRRVAPGRLLAITSLGIFLAEVVAMLVIYGIGPLPFAAETLLDALIMTVLIFPLLYFLSFKPLLAHIAERERAENELRREQARLELHIQERTADLVQAEKELRKAYEMLEQRVQQRTQELALANEELKAEIAERMRVEDQIRLQSSALEAAANGIIISGRKGNIRWINPAFTRMTGYTQEEVMGQNPRLFKSGKHEPEFYRQMWETILAGDVWSGEMINRRKDGSLYTEEQTITPLLDENGEITHFIAIKHDITERKLTEQALRQNEALFRTVLEALPVGVWITDEKGTVLQGNPATQEIWAGARYVGIEGYVEYKGWWLDSGKLIEPEEWAAARAIRRGERVLNEEVEIESFDGTHKIILNSAIPLPDEQGAIRGAVVVNQDITERKRTEEQLALRNNELVELTNAERKQRQTAEALCTAAQSLTQTLRLEQVVDSLLDHINWIIPYDTASVALFEEEAQLAVRAVRGNGHWTDFSAILGEQAATNPIVQELLSTRKSLVIPKLTDNPIREITPKVEDFQSWLVTPIVTSEKAIGVVWLGKSEPDFFVPEHTEWTEALVGQAGVAIQNAWLFEQVRANSERLQFLAHRLVDVQENELRYIAQELHDEVGQAITALELGIQLIQKEADKPEVIRAESAKMDRMMDNVMENLHRLAMNLRPASLDRLGLQAALSQHIETLRGTSSLEIQFEMIGVDERLPANMEIALYRIVQEAINNVVRHAQATQVDVLIQTRNGSLVIIIEDNGLGFDPVIAQNSDRLGLFGMRERAEMLGGRLVIESAAGHGTTILVEVPYAYSNSHSR